MFTSNSTNSTTLYNTDTPKSLPIKDLDFIAPYWFDAGILDENDCSHILNFTETTNLNTSSFVNETYFVNETSTNCRHISTVYYRKSDDYQLRERASEEIRANFIDAMNNYFYAKYLFIITWIIIDPKDNPSEPKVHTYIINANINYFHISGR